MCVSVSYLGAKFAGCSKSYNFRKKCNKKIFNGEITNLFKTLCKADYFILKFLSKASEIKMAILRETFTHECVKSNHHSNKLHYRIQSV